MVVGPATYVVLLIVGALIIVGALVLNRGSSADRSIDSPAEHESRTCPHCGSGNEPQARFCAHCGKPLDGREV